MPSFVKRIPLIANGPIILAKVSVNRIIRNDLSQNGKNIPMPIQVNALIDTGASFTCISSDIAKQLNLSPHGLTNILTAGHPNLSNIYDVFLDIGVDFDTQLVFDPIRVVEVPLIGQSNIGCIIGRDILSKGVLVYIGCADTFSFSV